MFIKLVRRVNNSCYIKRNRILSDSDNKQDSRECQLQFPIKRSVQKKLPYLHIFGQNVTFLFEINIFNKLNNGVLLILK